MAGDWIKMRLDLCDDPAVVAISCALDVSEDEVVGKLHRLWSWADRHTTDGTAPGITAKWVDRYVGASGFAAAMEQAGWIAFSAAGVTFPNFERHNGKSAKSRCDATIRQRLSRQICDKSVTGDERLSRQICDKSVTGDERLSRKSCDKSVTGDERLSRKICDKSVTREEKIREDKKRKEKTRKENTRAADAASCNRKLSVECPEEVQPTVWADWNAVRKAKRAGPATATALARVRNQAVMAHLSLNDAIAMSAARGWVSFEAGWIHGNGHGTVASSTRSANEQDIDLDAIIDAACKEKP